MIHEPENLNELLEGFLSGEDGKTNALIAFFYKYVYNNCYKLVLDSDSASDLTQDSFIRAYKYKETYNKSYKFSNWLLKISTNACMDFLKQRKKDRVRLVYIESIEAEVGGISKLKKYLIDEKFECLMDEKFERELLESVIKLLPDIYRVVLILRFDSGFKYEEIAQMLNIPVGTVKFRINRARRILTKLLVLAENN
jgi:RNA polymerase sigma-70 factor (ECF subfamily)